MLPRIGELGAALVALEYVEIALAQRPSEPDAAAAGDGVRELEALVVALANLSALLLRFLERGAPALDAARLLALIREDQHLQQARRDLSGLDHGWPFDA